VDSAVAALRLVQAGRTLEAANVRSWPGTDRRSCCSPDAQQRAARSAAHVGIPFQVLDLADDFETRVVAPFVAGYLAGETPNPCVACNPRRLAALVRLADERGLDHVVTGHYARLVWRGGRPFVARGADRDKDQSYMLWAVPEDVLARLEFPLGESNKRDTRALATAAELSVADEPGSQEVCFAVEGYRRFLEERGVPPRRGAIVDRAGRALGEHDGHWRYTIGQRRGLGIAAPHPLFVLERRAARNEIVVGDRESLDVREVVVKALVDRGLGDGCGLSVQLRYRSCAVPVADVRRIAADVAVVTLDEAFAGLAPGQSAVFYRDDVIVAGGLVAAPGSDEGGYDTLRPRTGS
jgi:tRNA-uridine 2-sulfurtransferase